MGCCIRNACAGHRRGASGRLARLSMSLARVWAIVARVRIWQRRGCNIGHASGIFSGTRDDAEPHWPRVCAARAAERATRKQGRSRALGEAERNGAQPHSAARHGAECGAGGLGHHGGWARATLPPPAEGRLTSGNVAVKARRRRYTEEPSCVLRA